MNTYKDHPGQGFVPVKGYTPPGGSMAEQSVLREQQRAAEDAQWRAHENMQRNIEAQQARERAAAAERQRQNKLRAQQQQKKKPQQKSVKSAAASSDGNPIDGLIAFAGGGGAFYLAALSEASGLGLLISAVLGATIAYALKGVIKGLIGLAIIIFIAAQLFG